MADPDTVSRVSLDEQMTSGIARLTGLAEPGEESLELHGPGQAVPSLAREDTGPDGVARPFPGTMGQPLELPGGVTPMTAVAAVGGEAAFVLALAGWVRRRRSRRDADPS